MTIKCRDHTGCMVIALVSCNLKAIIYNTILTACTYLGLSQQQQIYKQHQYPSR